MSVKEKEKPTNCFNSQSVSSSSGQNNISLIHKKTPKQTIHAWCHSSCIQSRLESEVENCGGHLVYATGKPCRFFAYRMNKRPPMKVFRQFCLECMGGSSALVRECETDECQMHLYRFGKNPSIKGANRERMNAIRPPGTLFPTVKTVQNRFAESGPREWPKEQN